MRRRSANIPFKAAMLVFSDLLYDARVAKEAKSVALAFPHIELSVLALRVNRDLIDFPREVYPFRVLETHARHAGPGRSLLKKLSDHLILCLRFSLRLLRERPGLIHCHDINTLFFGFIIAKLIGAKLVYDAHEISSDRQGYQKFRWAVKLVEGWMAPRADLVITTNGMRARKLQELYEITLPMIVENRAIAVTLPPVNRLFHERFALDAERIVVLYQGNLNAGRGLTKVLALAARFPRLFFVLMGKGALSDELQRKPPENLGFVDPVPWYEMHRFTSAADIGLQLLENTCFNHYSTISNKVFEYITFGVAVIASDFPEIRRVVETCEAGLLVDPSDIDSVASALARLSSDLELLTRFKASCRAAAQRVSWQEQEPRFAAIFKGLLPEPANPF